MWSDTANRRGAGIRGRTCRFSSPICRRLGGGGGGKGFTEFTLSGVRSYCAGIGAKRMDAMLAEEPEDAAEDCKAGYGGESELLGSSPDQI